MDEKHESGADQGLPSGVTRRSTVRAAQPRRGPVPAKADTGHPPVGHGLHDLAQRFQRLGEVETVELLGELLGEPTTVAPLLARPDGRAPAGGPTTNGGPATNGGPTKVRRLTRDDGTTTLTWEQDHGGDCRSAVSFTIFPGGGSSRSLSYTERGVTRRTTVVVYPNAEVERYETVHAPSGVGGVDDDRAGPRLCPGDDGSRA